MSDSESSDRSRADLWKQRWRLDLEMLRGIARSGERDKARAILVAIEAMLNHPSRSD